MSLISFPLIMSLILISICMITLTSFSDVNSLFQWNFLNYLNFEMIVDPTSTIFLSVVTLISFSVMLFTSSYMANDQRLKYFTFMVMLFIIAMMTLIIVPNLIFLMIGWDGLGVTSFLLVVYYMGDKSFLSGMITLLTNRIGDCFLLIACSWSFSSMNWSYPFMEYKLNWVVVLVMMLGAFTKSAQRPFCSWLPAAMAAPTPVSALVHSSTLVTAGVFLMIRFYPSLSKFCFFHSILLYTGIITCLLASTSALYETDLKKIIALSTLSQLGVMFITLGLGEPEVCFFHLVTHALFKALLFMCAGSIIHSSSDIQDIRLMGSVYSSMPLTSMTMNIANLSLCGIPFLSGFYSKDSLIELFMMSSHPLFSSMLLFLSVVSTSAYTIRMSYYSMWDSYKGNPLKLQNDESMITLTSYIALMLGAITGGAIFQWKFEPSLMPMILPFYMKISTLVMVTIFGMMMFYVTKEGKIMMLSNFFVSMWFTNYSSGMYNHMYKNMLKKLLAVELYWMEMLGGVGLKTMLMTNQMKAQNFISSNWVLCSSTMLFSVIIIMLLYWFFSSF